MNYYLLFKSLHLIAVISWMAGFLYLPRIFVYHVENKEKKKLQKYLKPWKENFILYYETSYDFSWLFGLLLIYINGFDVLF